VSTYKTPYLALHSWIDTDRVRMNEFNENFTTLDAYLMDLTGGEVAIPDGATSIAVNFISPRAIVLYAPSAMPTWNTTVWVSNKTTTGFTINFGTPAPAGAGSKVYWGLSRYY
jgi:hypothetical protein